MSRQGDAPPSVRPPRSPSTATDPSQELGRLRALLAHTADPLDLLDRDGRILYVSPSRDQPLGYPDGNLGRNALELIHPDDQARIGALFAELREAPRGTSRNAEFRARHHDGSWRWLESTSTNLLDDPDVRAIVLSLRDVSERKKAEAELRMSQRLASIGILAAGIGHEINNPLTAVLSSLGVAERTLDRLRGDVVRSASLAPDLDHVYQGVALARDGAARIAGVVGGLRALSRPQASESSRVSVAHAVDAALSVARASFSGRVSFARTGGEVLHVLADEPQLGQVILNLLTNAAQAIPEGRGDGLVEVGTRVEPGVSGEHGRVVIEVRDNGTGILPEHLPHVFDPFFTTKAREHGSGLGLAISHRIVAGFGGAISVESALGSGATFRVTLPAAPVVGDATPVNPAPSAGRPRLLLIDDEPRLALALAALLEGDYDVRASTSAREALDTIRAGVRYDVILCDLMMSGMGGIEFEAALRPLAPELADRMVFMTGGAFTPAARAFVARSAAPCLPKPLDFDQLQRVLRERTRG